MSPAPAQDRAITWAVIAILAITVARVLLLIPNQTDLFVDEAQYWQWGQELDFGYYSKPPLIAWVIRAVTELAGSDAPFWIRLPGPLLHAATALILIAVARRLAPPAAAAFVGVAYVTLPAVALASLLISTDTVLLPFFAAAMLLYLRLVDRPSIRDAALMGICIGMGMLGKYAAIYFILCAALAALFLRDARIGWRDALVAALLFVVVWSPNIYWNLANGLTTVAHTADNVDWINDPSARLTLNLSGALEFVAAQFGVMGPVMFGAYLWALGRLARRGATHWSENWLVWMSLPIFALVTTQALLSKALANWAVTGCLAALLLAVPLLWRHAPRLLWIGLAFNLGLCVLLPVASTVAPTWRLAPDERLLLRRYVGRAALSRQVIEAAQARGVGVIAAADRGILADLFHTGRDSGLRIYSLPFDSRVPHFYAQAHSLPDTLDEPYLFVTFNADTLTCPEGRQVVPIESWPAGPGAHFGNRVDLYLLEPECRLTG